MTRRPPDGDAPAIERWLAAAVADAERRGLPELGPLLRGLAESTAALRAATWNDRADDAGAEGADASRPARIREDAT